MDIEQLLKESAARTQEALDALTAARDDTYPEIFDAVRYSLLSGGKRIRPFLADAFCVLFGGDRKTALQLGCALEMIHTYSLIHDDMPCMDNDDLRRGRPTNHKVFGEATAMLAGDELLTFAFETASAPCVPAETALCAVRLLSRNAGVFGMIGGQMLDLKGETEALGFETLLHMHGMKTGALIESACLLGCLSANITDPADARYRAAQRYAHGVGLAFQIIDDLLDVTGSAEILGKPIGSDAESSKTTFLSFMTQEEAFAYAQKLTAEAKEAVQPFEGSAVLSALADYLLTRQK